MADPNPTGTGPAVALTIPPDDRKYLRSVFEMARDGIRAELSEHPDRLREPARVHREEAIYERLLAALDTGSIVPDRDVRDVLGDLATVIDSGNEFKRVVAEHEALHGLLGQLTEGRGR
jgi:hypothetical protein